MEMLRKLFASLPSMFAFPAASVKALFPTLMVAVVAPIDGVKVAE